MDASEKIEWQGEVLAYFVRAELEPAESTFLTPPELDLQVGYAVKPAGAEVRRHTHLGVRSRSVGTSEVAVVKKGRCLVDVYAPDHQLVATREMGPGDLVILVAGGHGFRMLEDTVLLDVKQGPYPGVDDKHHF